MKRGDLVTVAMPGDFGKPRPALVIQFDQFDTTATLTVLLVSGTLVDAPLAAAVAGRAHRRQRPAQAVARHD